MKPEIKDLSLIPTTTVVFTTRAASLGWRCSRFNVERREARGLIGLPLPLCECKGEGKMCALSHIGRKRRHVDLESSPHMVFFQCGGAFGIVVKLVRR